MNWSSYEVFSVLGGITLLAVALVPSAKAKTRVWCAVGGVFLVVYGFYVAGQTSGTWTFPVEIFVIPFAAAGYVLYQLAKRKGYLGGDTGEDRDRR